LGRHITIAETAEKGDRTKDIKEDKPLMKEKTDPMKLSLLSLQEKIRNTSSET